MNVQEEQKFPQLGDEYWYITDGGDVDSFGWEFVEFDLSAQAIGNVYKTEQEAEFALEKLKVEAELRKFSRPFERNSFNLIMYFDIEQDGFYSETRRFMVQGAFYFESEEKAQQAIDTVGVDRIKKYIFGVED